MKKTFVNRIAVFLLAMVMMIGTAVPAFAAECETVPVEATVENNEVMPRATDTFRINAQTIQAVKTTLSSYIGFTKTFHCDVRSDGGDHISGTPICLTLMNGNGTIMFEKYYVTVNQNFEMTFTLPKSGTYTLIVDNGTDYPLDIWVYWE